MLSEKYKKIAHRGLHYGNIPENSMAAFSKAIEKNYAIELDVHITKDNEIVVFHDDNLMRMTGVDKDIEDCTYAELSKIKLKNSSERIPTFKEVLRLISGNVGLLIEIKNIGIPGKLEKEVLRILKTYKGDYMIQSFNILSIIWFKKNAPHIIRGKLAAKSKMKLADKISEIFLYITARPNFISYRYEDISTSLINRCKLFGVKLYVWTIRTEEDYKIASKKCKGVIFENINI